MTPGVGEVKVKIAYAGLCGSDIEIVNETFGLQQTGEWPSGARVEGHEATGTIVELGADCCQGFQVGQRVGLSFRAACGSCYFCRNAMEHFCEHDSMASGTFAEYGTFPEGACYPIPDDMTWEQAALIEPLSIAVHTIDRAGFKSGESLLISGGGTIGLLALMVASKSGAYPILLSEPVAEKRALALKLGADYVVNPLDEDLEAVAAKVTDGRKFRAVMEASGNVGAARKTMNLVGRGGTVIWMAVYPYNTEIPVRPFEFYHKEYSLKGAWIAPYSFYRTVNVLNLLRKADLAGDGSPIVTSVYPIDDIQEAFEALQKRQDVKILIKM